MTVKLPALLDELFPDGIGAPHRTFALLDAARDERIYPALLGADCEWLCLYRGDASVSMAEVAPYLVELDPTSLFAPWLLENGWGNSWGIFFNAVASLEILRAHFRRFVMVQLPDGRSVYFRFYDPRVLRVYLPTCTAEELETMFGPVDRYVMEGQDGEVIAFPRETP
jgi:hypothetical protein